MQKYTSKNTSVNTKVLPAVYNKVCWDKFTAGARVLDWGCGKDTTLVKNILSKHGLVHIGYDPNWGSEENNSIAQSLLGTADVFVCSNVLNVIDDDNVITDICHKAEQHKYFFITVYEGDRSGVGKRSKEDCYQRNAKPNAYIQYFSTQHIYIKKGVITNAPDMIK